MKAGRTFKERVGFGAFGLCTVAFACAGEPADQSNSAHQTEAASQVFDRIFPSGLTPRQRSFIHAALQAAPGFAVLPGMTKIGLGVSQFQGRGVLAYRDGEGRWQPPLPLVVSGSSVGPHYAMITFDSLAVIRTPQALQRLLAGKIMPTGREMNGGTPRQSVLENEDIIAYTRSQGFSGGCSQDDIHVDLDVGTYESWYGVQPEPRSFLEGRFDTCRRPYPAQKLVEDAKVRSGNAPLTTIWITPGPPEP